MNLELEAYEGELRALRALVISAGHEMKAAVEEIANWKEIVRNENTMTQKYKDGYDAAMRIIKSTYPDKFPDTYFICGEGGEKDKNNLPDTIHVCPAYGCDWFQVYKKTDQTWGPEY